MGHGPRRGLVPDGGKILKIIDIWRKGVIF